MSTNIYAKSVIKALLAHSDYDGEGRSAKTISASALSKSVRQLTFDITHPETRPIIRPDQAPAIKLGSGFHYYVEKIFENTEDIADYFVDALATTDSLDISQEQRANKDITLSDGSVWTITGKYDLVINGQLMDWKTTSLYGYKSKDNIQKYINQGSVYKWLNPTIITSSTVSILYLIKDWSYIAYLRSITKEDEYPESGIFSEDYPVLSNTATEELIKSKLEGVAEALNTSVIPLCTDEELWMRTTTTWKFYKDYAPGKRATKNFKTPEEAHSYMAANSARCRKPMVKEVTTKTEANACYYCKHAFHCEQAETLQTH